MILADKIIQLRKKNGWSQEELAEKLGVSRQSISKYEGALAVPDMDKILKLSKIFGVTTDFLIKDEMEIEEYTPAENLDFEENKVHNVSMEMANEFIDYKFNHARKIALSVMLYILSPIVIVLLGGYAACKVVTENFATAVGISVLLVIVAIATGIILLTKHKGEKYKVLEEEYIETAYGVSGMVKNRKEKFNPIYIKNMVIGIALAICSPVPIFVVIYLSNKQINLIFAVILLLIIVSLAAYSIVKVSIMMSSLNCLLEEGDYTRYNKKANKVLNPFYVCYWLFIVGIYLVISFLTAGWSFTWIVWPIAGVLFPIVTTILKSIFVKK